MATTILYPDGDSGTPVNVVNQSGGTTNLYTAVDEWGAGQATSTADYVVNSTYTVGTKYHYFTLTSVPADFKNATALTITLYFQQEGKSDDVVQMYADVWNAAKTIALTSTQLPIYEGPDTREGLNLIWTTLTKTFTGVSTTATAADWDGAVLRILWNWAGITMGNDNVKMRVAAVQLDMTYAQLISSSPDVGTITLTGYAPEAIVAPMGGSPDVGAITLTGYAPQILAPITVPTGALSLTGYEPLSLNGKLSAPTTGAISFTGYAPTIQIVPILFYPVPFVERVIASTEWGGTAGYEAMVCELVPRYYLNTEGSSIYRTTVAQKYSSTQRGKLIFHNLTEANGYFNVHTSSGGVIWNPTTYWGRSTFTTDHLVAMFSQGGTGGVSYTLGRYRDYNLDQDHVIYETEGPVRAEITSGISRKEHFSYLKSTTEIYCFANKTSGTAFPPAVYKWNGSAWDAGTIFLPAGTYTGAWTATMHWWVRADMGNRDRVYVCYTCAGGGSNVKIIVALDLSTSIGTVVYTYPNSTYALTSWTGLGNREHVDAYVMPHMDPCQPIDLGTGNSHYWIRDRGDSSDKMLKLELNVNNWLAPTATIYNNTQPADPDPGWDTIRHRFTFHYTVWDVVNDKVYNVKLAWIVWTDVLKDALLLISKKDLTTEPNGAYSSWQYIETPYPPRYYSLGQYYHETNRGATTFSFGWSQRGGRGGTRLPIAFWVQYFEGDVGLTNYGPDEIHSVSYWIDGGKNNWLQPISVTANIPSSVVINTGIYFKPTITVDVGDSVNADVQAAEFYAPKARYFFLDAGSIIDTGVTVDVTDSASVVIDLDSVIVPVTVIVGDSSTVTVDTPPIQFRWMNVSSVLWDHTWIAGLITKVNASRAIAGQPPVGEISSARQMMDTSVRGVEQVHAEDMAKNDLFTYDSALFTDGLENTQQRTDASGTIDGLEQVIRFELLPHSNDPEEEVGLIVSDASFPSVEYFWTTLGYGTSLADRWNVAFANGHTELFLQVGVAFGKSAAYPDLDLPYNDPNVVWMHIRLVDFTGATGSPGTIVPTPPTNERTARSTWVHVGMTWQEELLTLTNNLRALYGLPPFLLPDLAFFQKYPLDVTTQHAQNCLDAQTIDHESDTLPQGWRLVADRAKLAGYNAMTENIYFGQPYSYDDQNPGAIDQRRAIYSDESFPTPLEAYTGWYNSPGHRANLLRNWGQATVYHVFGWAAKKYPYPTTITDEYHGTTYPGSEGYWFVLNNNFADVSQTVATRYLNSNWQITGALIEQFNVNYALYCYVDVKAAFTSSYSIRVGVDHSANYDARVAVQHVAPIYYSLSAAHSALYTQTSPVKAAHSSVYRIWNTEYVAKDHEAPYGLNLTAHFIARYDSSPQVRSDHSARYDSLSSVKVAFSAPYTATTPVLADHSGIYSYLTPVKNDHNSKYTLLSYEPVVVAHQSFYTLLGDAVVQTPDDVTLTLGSRTIDILDLSLSQEEDDPAWVARVRLANVEDFPLMQEGVSVVLTIGLEVWNLVITEASLQRQHGSLPDMQVKLESPISLLMSPRSSQYDYTNNAIAGAKELVESILGQSVTWQILDWTIPEKVFAASNVEPYDAAKIIVEACGGIIQSNPDGTLVVRYYAPTPMDKLWEVAADVTLTDVEHNLSVSEAPTVRSGINRVRVFRDQALYNDSMQWEPEAEKPSRGILKVYPSPWRTNFDVRSTDSGSTTSKTLIGVVTDTFTDQVDFKEGVGNTSKPIKTVTTVEWLSDSLGATTFTPYSTSLSVGTGVNGGYGLAKVTYTSESVQYQLSGVLGDVELFVMEGE